MGVGAIVQAVVAGAVSVATGGIPGFTLFASFAIAAAGSLALSALSQALAPKPEIPNLQSFSAEARDRTQMVRQPITAWSIVYGELYKSGPMTFIESTEDNKYLHIIITLASHPCEAIHTIFLNEEPIFEGQLDGDGVVTSGKYANKVKFQYDLGTTNQPFPDLVSASSTWTSAYRQKGRTKLYARLEFDKDLFPTRIPNIKVRMKGKKVYDTRTSTTYFSNNSALCINDYMVTPEDEGGLGATQSEIDTSTLDASANVCDEMVATKAVDYTIDSVDTGNNTIDLTSSEDDILKYQTGDRVQVTTTGSLPGGISGGTNYFVIVSQEKAFEDEKLQIKLASSYANALAGTAISLTSSGSGTHTISKNAEPRYTANGVVVTDKKPIDILNDMRTSFAGRIVPVGGSWLIDAGAWKTPTVTFDENDLRGPIKLVTRHSRRDRFNAVKGVYSSPLTLGIPTDYPIVTNSTYETNDGGDRIFRELDLPFTTRPQTAQRIATIELHRHRREISADLKLNLTGMQVQAIDTVKVDNDRFGWSEKTFEIAEWVLTSEGDPPVLGVDLKLRESDSAVFDFDETSEETQQDPPPTTNLPDAYNITAPSNVTLSSGTNVLYVRKDGTVQSRLKVEWDQTTDYFVISNGRIEVQYKKSADSEWDKTGFIPGDDTNTYIFDVEDEVNYDVRVRFVSTLGVRSSWTTVTGHTVLGKSEPPSDVTGFSSSLEDGGIRLTWNAISDVDLKEYEIRKGTTWSSGTSVAFIDGTSYLDTQVSSGGTIDYMIKAVDTSGNESNNTDTTQIVVSAPSAPATITLSSGTNQLFVTGSGEVVSRIFVEWDAVSHNFLGNYEIQHKVSSDSEWSSVLIGKDTTEYYISPVLDGENYDVRVRAVTTFGLEGSWVTESNHTVIGKTEPPADVTSFSIDGNLLYWTHPETEPDLDGYIIKFHYGSNRNWDTATRVHSGILKDSPYEVEVRPQDQITLMIKAVDTTGNESTNVATILTNLGDPLVANVVEGFAQETTWTGTKTNGTVEGGELKADTVPVLMWDADDTTLMWDADDTVYMWETITYKAMTYEFTFTPSLAAEGSNITLVKDLQGEGLTIEYKTNEFTMWNTDDTVYMWTNDTALMWQTPSYKPWTGSVTAKNQQYSMRVSTQESEIRGIFTELKPQIDLPDIEESFSNVSLASGGTRLSITETYFAITNVNATLQDDGGTAATVKVIDKDINNGPLLQAFDSSDNPTTAEVDATVQGY